MTTTTDTTDTIDAIDATIGATMEQAGALAQRMFSSVLATMELLTVYLGTRLGLYEHLRDPRTVGELAAASGVLPRYVQEWCEQQAACGLLHVEDAAAEPSARRFVLPAGHAAALLDPDHPAYVGSVATMAGGMGFSMAAVLEAYRNGTGVSFGAYGDDVRDGQGQFNRAGFLGQLGSAWVPALPGVAPLLARDGAAALDVGCGVGWSTIALARAFPALRVTGVDSDEASITDARRNAAGSDVADRVRFEVRGASEPGKGESPGPPARWTSSSSSRRSTTWATPWRPSPPRGRRCARAGGSSSSTSARSTRSRPTPPRWNGCSTAPASCTACPSGCPSRGRPAPAR